MAIRKTRATHSVHRKRRAIRGLRLVRRLPATDPGFLRLERWTARNLYADGAVSTAYTFDVVHRRTLDAVAIIPYFFAGTGPGRRLMVVYKVGFRPGLHLRSRLRPPVRERAHTQIPEAVAGSLEQGDRGERGIDARARAELFEETGLRPRRSIERLGAGFFPSHGQSTEKVHLRAAHVDLATAVPPPGDGSINEKDAGTAVMEAARLLRDCRSGRIEDPKLEIGVGRLCRRLRYPV